MKLLRLLCNFFLWVSLVIGISTVQVGLFNLTAIQSSDVEEIHMSSRDDDEIAYFDSYAFWFEDIKENLNQDPKYRIRNWADWSWWKNGMKWADTGLDTVIAVFKPVVVPIAQVNNVRIYNESNINSLDVKEIKDSLYYSYFNTQNDNWVQELNNDLYEMYMFDQILEGNQFYVDPETEIYTFKYEDGVFSISDIKLADYAKYYNGSHPFDISEGEDAKAEYARWVNLNSDLYNINWKLQKYNSETYDKYRVKFINDDNHIKPAAVVLYYQQFVSLILATIFVIKYPIQLFQAKIESSDITGSKKKNNK